MTSPIPPSPPVAGTLSDVIEQIKSALKGKWGFRPTPGPWFGEFDGVYEGGDRDSLRGRISSSMATRGKTEAEEANNVYIAACNPENVRILLAAISAKEAEVGRLREALVVAEAALTNTARCFLGQNAEHGDINYKPLIIARAALTQGETK